MDNKTYHAFTSTEGNQTSYYFTDAADENLANQEAVKAAVKHFNLENPTVQKIEDEFIGLPEKVKEPYVWFIGVENMFAKPQPSIEESNEAAQEAEVKTVKSERKTDTKHADKKTANKTEHKTAKKAAKKKS